MGVLSMKAQTKILAGIAIAAIILSVVSIGLTLLVWQELGVLREEVNTLSKDIESLREAVATPSPTPTTTPPSPPRKVTLVVYGPWAGKEEEYFRAVINAYMKEHPNVEIKYVVMRAEDLAAVMPAQFAAGISSADVIITPWAWWIVEMAKKGYVEEVTGLINEDEYVPGIVDKVKWNGKLWGVPFTMWLKPGFWYRKSFFEAHGLSEPKTWDEFLSLLDKIKAIEGIKNPIVTGDEVGWPISDVTEHFIITFGGPELQLKLISGEVKFNDPQVKEIFEKYLVPLIKNGYFSEPIEWTTAISKWWAGEYGLYFMGTWITGMVDDPNDLGFFPLPGCKGVVGGADYAFVPKYAPNKEEALKFLKFLATKGQEIHAAQPSGKIPTWTKVPVDKLWGPMQDVYRKVNELGLQILPDLDDSVGGDWQTLFWDQLKLLWVNPDKLDEVLNTLTENFPG